MIMKREGKKEIEWGREKDRERVRDVKTSQHKAPPSVPPLNVFRMDLGLFTESFKRR